MRAVDIFESIEQAIAQKELKTGDRLAPVREAAEHWNVNKNTVAAAYRMLQDAGLIIASGRNGSIVSGPAAHAPLAGSGAAAPDGTLLLHDGNPDRSLLPSESLVRPHLMRVGIEPRLYGELPKIDALLDWASDSFDTDGVESRRTFVSSGALDAMAWAMRTCLKVGDHVGVEDPTYATTLGLSRSMGMRPVGIAMDAHGIVPQSLQRAIDKGCKVVVLSSRVQNPTGICTSAQRADELGKIVAAASQTLFIDDDHSSMLQMHPYHAFVSQNAERWMVIRSVSKFLGPDLRVAVCRGDDTTLGRVERGQSYAMSWVSSLLQKLAGSLLHDRQVRALIKKAGVTYGQRYEAAKKSLAELGFETIGTTGLNIWVPYADEATLTQQMLGQGWKIRSGMDFTVNAPAGFRVTTASLNDSLRSDFMEALRHAVHRRAVVTA